VLAGLERCEKARKSAGFGCIVFSQGERRIDVKRSIALRSIKTKGEVRLDDNETRISGARRADVTASSI
jgi:hypothetical protein